MNVHCSACRRVINVPDERASNPRLKIKCGCGTIFALGEASIATAAPPPAPAASPAPAPPPVPPAPSAARPAAAAAPSSPPAASPRPAPPSPPREPARVSFQSTAAMGEGATGGPRGAAWRRCAKHPQVRSVNLCPQCMTGFCPDCVNKVQNAVTCPACEVLCLASVDYEERLRRDRQRARPMLDELSTILSYPLNDPTAYVMLAVFTCVFAALGNFAVLYGKMIAVLFSQGVLMAYCFSALTRVSNGNFKDYMPDIGDITDLVRSLRLGVTALVAGSGPLLLVALLIPGAAILGGFKGGGEETPATAEQVPYVMGEGGPEVVDVSTAEPGAESEGGVGLLGLAAAALVFGGLALLWKVIYTPVALTVAGLSRSSLSTLNPVIGFETIRTMGAVYWQAMGIYTVIVVVEWLLTLVLGFIPILGAIVAAFVAAYAYLMIGCTLGLAVFKKAPELGLE
jgi:hypothetical protein